MPTSGITTVAETLSSARWFSGISALLVENMAIRLMFFTANPFDDG
jgi:hypothetical protein